MRKSHILIVLLSILCLPLSAQTERETESIVLEQGRQTKEKKPFREVLNDLFKRPGTRQIRQEKTIFMICFLQALSLPIRITHSTKARNPAPSRNLQSKSRAREHSTSPSSAILR